MNSKEFEILNSKMDMIFDAIQNLRKEKDYERQEMKERSLECKYEDARRDLDWAKENRERINNYYKEVNNNYYGIQRIVEERNAREMREACERGTKMHAPEYMEEIK